MTKLRRDELKRVLSHINSFINSDSDYVTTAPMWEAGAQKIKPLTFGEFKEMLVESTDVVQISRKNFDALTLLIHDLANDIDFDGCQYVVDAQYLLQRIAEENKLEMTC